MSMTLLAIGTAMPDHAVEEALGLAVELAILERSLPVQGCR
ncbi:MAG: hypothetical protein WED27_06830 [Pirellulales bacterium]